MSTSGNKVGVWSRRKIREKEKRQEVKKKSHRMLTRRERERSRPERQFVTSDCPQVESERDAFEGQIGCDPYA